MSDCIRGFRAVLFDPPAHEPVGCRERFGNIEGLSDRAAQDRVHKSSGRCLPGPSHQFHGIVNGGVIGNPVEEADLIQGHLKRRANRGVETFDRALRILSD